jgi:hypothetical protein
MKNASRYGCKSNWYSNRESTKYKPIVLLPHQTVRLRFPLSTRYGLSSFLIFLGPFRQIPEKQICLNKSLSVPLSVHHSRSSSHLRSNMHYFTVALCSSVVVDRRFGGKYCLRFYDRRLRQATKKKQAGGCLRGSLCEPEDGGSKFPQNVSEHLVTYTASHNPEDSTLHSHRCENLRSNIVAFVGT